MSVIRSVGLNPDAVPRKRVSLHPQHSAPAPAEIIPMSVRFEDIDVSTFSLEQLQALMEMARKEIDVKEQSRLMEVAAQIQSLASGVGRSVEEILSMSSDGKRKRGPARTETGEKIVKFRNTENPDETWSGRGKRPRWLQEALQNGADIQSFAV